MKIKDKVYKTKINLFLSAKKKKNVPLEYTKKTHVKWTVSSQFCLECYLK